jgi:hypothetical protein
LLGIDPEANGIEKPASKFFGVQTAQQLRDFDIVISDEFSAFYFQLITQSHTPFSIITNTTAKRRFAHRQLEQIRREN